MKPQTVEKAQLWCRACEEGCFEMDMDSLWAFFQAHVRHLVRDLGEL